ncbi:signal peptidase I [Dictyobacter arantiisoli]|uniref:Signal peptidase I n=1 Tax=Dictyobacter arantiisoli TaxID=2014874 RepID=A0A5A5TE99_9CHLR|nr:signal peptidase I [Dictyobacter arantiisoli]GCF09881.1 signal peptidase I [Dictyobacter arantiisoli]
MKRSQLAREIVEILALTILIFLVVRFVVQSYRVDGPSMQPGLVTDQYVMVNKVNYLFHGPERGDVIVFHYPRDVTQNFIKRVIGLPGDTITTDRDTVTVNGKVLDEKAYISAPYNLAGQTWTVPANQYFVMGDNRPVSDDSRTWGFVPRDYIVGKAVLVFWPLNHIHFIDTHSDVYKDLPNK